MLLCMEINQFEVVSLSIFVDGKITVFSYIRHLTNIKCINCMKEIFIIILLDYFTQ